jgi:hypothetical protein
MIALNNESFVSIYNEALVNLRSANKYETSLSYAYDNRSLLDKAEYNYGKVESYVSGSKIELYNNLEYRVVESLSSQKEMPSKESEQNYSLDRYYYLKAPENSDALSLCSYYESYSNSLPIIRHDILNTNYAQKDNGQNKINDLFYKELKVQTILEKSFNSFYRQNGNYYASLYSVTTHLEDNVLYPGDIKKQISVNNTIISTLTISKRDSHYYIESLKEENYLDYGCNYHNEVINKSRVSASIKLSKYYYDSLSSGKDFTYPSASYDHPVLVLCKFDSTNNYLGYKSLSLTDTSDYSRASDIKFTGSSFAGFMKIDNENYHYSFSTTYLVSRATPTYEYIGYNSINKDTILYNTITDPKITGHLFFDAIVGNFSLNVIFDELGNVKDLNVVYVGQ